MLENDQLVRRLKVIAGLGVSARQGRGLDDAAIREQVVRIGIDSIRKHMPDETDVETAVCVVQREVDRILGGGEPLAVSVPVDSGADQEREVEAGSDRGPTTVLESDGTILRAAKGVESGILCAQLYADDGEFNHVGPFLGPHLELVAYLDDEGGLIRQASYRTSPSGEDQSPIALCLEDDGEVSILVDLADGNPDCAVLTLPELRDLIRSNGQS